MILAGDVGGTKTRLAFFESDNQRLRLLEQAMFPSQKFSSFEEILGQFLAKHRRRVDCAAIGVAGPVFHERCHATNLPWTVESSVLAETTGIPHFFLLNDLEATAHSLGELSADEMVELQKGAADAQGNRAVIAAGTGLGEAGIYWNGRTYEPFACEGGHADFSPRNELEIKLLTFLLREYGHASWERVISGPGLTNIYRCLCELKPTELSTAVAREMVGQNVAELVTRAAIGKHCPVCVEALDLFVSLYGSESGNLALKIMATGGLYIAGGIAPKIISKLKGPAFLNSFSGKGRLRELLQKIPIHVILTDQAALRGAARYASWRSHLRTTCILP